MARAAKSERLAIRSFRISQDLQQPDRPGTLLDILVNAFCNLLEQWSLLKECLTYPVNWLDSFWGPVSFIGPFWAALPAITGLAQDERHPVGTLVHRCRRAC